MTDTNQSQNSQQEIQQSNILIEDAVKIRWNIWCGSRQFVKISIIIRNNNNEELIYIKNDKILRQEKILDLTNNIELMKNVEQINHLTWRGLFSNLKNKIGIWTAYWKLQKINVGGYYDQMSQKQGKWIEIFENYCEQFSLFKYIVLQMLFIQANIKMGQNVGYGKQYIRIKQCNISLMKWSWII
ncbi:unnamed protein product [Paramecium primaurelia]|uniref:Uncharacterized protein n=1 Tax=Paramecium primaurelia TaxID=5886 RepID=A0A8S1NGK2_PARPR|nr:unnamed protein product [Paramecium primaurelia]